MREELSKEDMELIKKAMEKLNITDIKVPNVFKQYELVEKRIAGNNIFIEIPQPLPKKIEVHFPMSSSYLSSGYAVKELLEEALDLECTNVKLIDAYPYKMVGFECVRKDGGHIRQTDVLIASAVAEKLSKEMLNRELGYDPEDREIIRKWLEEKIRKSKGKRREIYEAGLEALERGEFEDFVGDLLEEHALGYLKGLGKELAKHHKSEIRELAKRVKNVIEEIKEELRKG